MEYISGGSAQSLLARPSSLQQQIFLLFCTKPHNLCVKVHLRLSQSASGSEKRHWKPIKDQEEACSLDDF